MGKRIISAPQAAVLLTLCQLFNALLFSPLAHENQDSSLLLYGSLAAVGLTIVLLLPAFCYFWARPNTNILDDCLRTGTVFGRICLFLFWLLLMATLLHTAAKFNFFMTVAIFPNASSWLVLAAFLIACAYGASMGLEGLARAAGIMIIFLVAAMLWVDFSLLKEMQPLNIRPLLPEQAGSILEIAWEQVTNNMALALLLLLMPRVKGSFGKVICWFIPMAGLLTVSVFAVTVLVLGDFLQNQSFPFYSIASIARTEIFQRLDVIQMSIWVLVVYVRMSVFLLFATELLQRMLPKRLHKAGFWSSLILLFGGSGALVQFVNHQEVGRAMWGTDVLLLLLLMAVPLILLLKRRGKHAPNPDLAADS